MGVMRFLGAALLLYFPASAEVVRFDNPVPGKLPTGWTVAMTHDGAPPRWEIVRDQSAPSPPYVLAQVSRDSTAGRFPLAIWNATTIRDGEVSGKTELGAGMYPSTLDLRDPEIKNTTDGELFYFIRNGIRNNGNSPKSISDRNVRKTSENLKGSGTRP